MAKILGLDLGTNSIGWAIVEQHETGYALVDKGVDIFQEGVARGQSNTEKPAVQERTNARASRRHYFRRRLRKIELLKVLVRHDFCPPLSEEQLAEWKRKKVYPLTEEFIRWQRTDDNEDRNPYRDRYRALTERLDLSDRTDRHALGRAFYHLAQRRGFLSNRKEQGGDAEEGKVKSGIEELTKEMERAGCTYLGEYFYRLYRAKDKIRTKYTSRNEHYLAEFRAICEKQQLPEELRKALHRALFYQRPLKSQKGQVGKCTFEKGKSRCPASHPHFEEYRMLCFINNIRIQMSDDAQLRPLSREEKEVVRPLFLRKSKVHFDFEEIAKKIAGKGRYACKGDRIEAPYRFNFARTATVSGCPVTTALKDIFGDDWLAEICALYTLGAGKNERQILNDVWHALFSFTDEDKLCAWAREKLQLSDADAQKFAAIRLPQDYAALSLNAIDKMLPYLREGYRYDEAVFVANLKAVLPAAVWNDETRRYEIEREIADRLSNYTPNPYDRYDSKERCISDYLHDCGIDNVRIDRLYHPSMIETYRDAQPDAEGLLRLGSPRTSSVRNPMAMRALFRLRALVNALLREGKIDRNTKINIEFSRGLNDANRRKAIEQYQRDREREHAKFAEEIRRQYEAATGVRIDPSDNEVLKYRLWEEQNHQCLYTGKQIGIADFIGASACCDIEHTVPRSRGGDDSQMNKTLCENRFNREQKRAKLPAELSVHAGVLARIETLGWPKKIEELQKRIEVLRRKSKNAASDKEKKDKVIQERHKLQMELDYWRGKYERFTMTEVPEGFSNRQGVDIGIIGKYARLYLKTVFDRIYTVKGQTTAEFRQMWGLQPEYEKKERVNHVHHCIDAITIACIGRKEYDRWAQYTGDEERYEWGEAAKPRFEKPWPTFTEDVKAVADELLVAHHTPDNMPKRSRKRLRVRGRVKCTEDGRPIYVQGDTARGSLHQQTFYGAIERDGEIKYVVRKPLDSLKEEKDIDKIVDEAVRQKVRAAVDAVGFKAAMDPGYTIWMNEEKRVPIRKVRIFARKITVAKSIPLKKQRDLSVKEYKRDYHVAGGGNYCMAIYEGTDRRGKANRTFEIVNNWRAARLFNRMRRDRLACPDLVSLSDKENGYPLKWILKTGTMVLFYEKTPEELYECTPGELAKRLYKLTKFSSEQRGNSTVVFKHHQEARSAKDLSIKKGVWKAGETYRPIIGMSHIQLNAFVEGCDFEMSVTGEIRFKR